LIVNTAQARFKEGYAKYVAEAFFATLIVHFLMFYFFPPFEFAAYQPAPGLMTWDPGTLPPPVVIEAPDLIKQPTIDHIPNIEEGDGEEEINIPRTSPRDLTEFRPSPMPEQEVEEFVAWDRMPVLVKAFTPAYPALARAAGIEGKVLLRVTIGSDGRVEKASVIRSDVTPAMERAAIAAVMRFEFEPAMQQNFPVRSLMAVPVWFRLR
jgi:TonB family protein